MSKNKKVGIQIKKVRGDIVHSTGRTGGITTHLDEKSKSPNIHQNEWWNTTWFQVLAFISILLTCLGYFGMQPHFGVKNVSPNYHSPKKSNTPPVLVKKDDVTNRLDTLLKVRSKKLKHKSNIYLSKTIVKPSRDTSKKQLQTPTVAVSGNGNNVNVGTNNGVVGNVIFGERHLTDDDKTKILNRIEELTKEFNIQGKKLCVFATVESNAQTFTYELKKYLAENGYNIVRGTFVEGNDGAAIRVFQSPLTNPEQIVIKVGILPQR
ncbi:hypothetical protein [Mucilaginibacter ginsenosidivorax]|uniref:Uncharacterized protein n=1 Tax=Mucilaginibacter ginsenosidivorax TaxID=862126 RepID=A0A5B8W3Y7_9SPHI|nr:hypothetical protein [Mucilaginibacter ginsenosidivorax]QEC78780.1 hypothetical protein FSB76_23550 [Mucilaginibacter ginsenosidivorax]